MSNNIQLLEEVEEMFNEVGETAEVESLLTQNALRQQIIFDVKESQNITISFEPHSSDVDVRQGPEDIESSYSLFETSVITVDAEDLSALLQGDKLSSHYLAGELDLNGIPPIWSILGPLFRINSELRCEAE